MRKYRHINLTRSAVMAGFILLLIVIYSKHDPILILIQFVFLQIAIGVVSVCLILLRIISLYKNKKAWLYFFCGTMQLGFFIMDCIFILLIHDLIKSGMMIFLGLNGMLAVTTFYDIYKPTDGKRNTAGDPGSPILIE